MAAGIVGDRQVGPIPGRVLFPILEAASNEGDAELQGQWAALLANCATGDIEETLAPAFLDVMRQMTPLHAKVLSYVLPDHADSVGDAAEPSGASVPPADVREPVPTIRIRLSIHKMFTSHTMIHKL